MATTIITELRRIVAPRLPNAPTDYEKRFHDQHSDVLRLYFNQLDALLAAILSSTGGGYLQFPYGSFFQDGTTTLSANITNVSTTPIQVASTASFPATGWILIENEIIAYTGKTGTTFTGITRGVLGTTNVAHTAGLFVSEVQGTGSPTAIGKVLFNNTSFSNSVYTTSADYSKIYFDTPGIFNLQFSAQLLNYTTSEDNVTVWFQKNGTDIAATASVEQVNSKHGSSPGATIMTVNILEQVAIGDYIQLAWTSNTGNSVIGTYPASVVAPVHPLSPGIILTATFVSAVPA